MEGDGVGQQADGLVVWPEAPQQVWQLNTGLAVREADLSTGRLGPSSQGHGNDGDGGHLPRGEAGGRAEHETPAREGRVSTVGGGYLEEQFSGTATSD